MSPVSPNNDFNLYCNQEWYKKNVIPKEYTRWGIFEELHELNKVNGICI